MNDSGLNKNPATVWQSRGSRNSMLFVLENPPHDAAATSGAMPHGLLSRDSLVTKVNLYGRVHFNRRRTLDLNPCGSQGISSQTKQRTARCALSLLKSHQGAVVLLPRVGVLEPAPVLTPPTPGPLPPTPGLPPNPVPGALVIPRPRFVDVFRPKLVPALTPKLVLTAKPLLPIPPVLRFPVPVPNDPGVAVVAPTLGVVIPGDMV
jgi:hypothetical protein